MAVQTIITAQTDAVIAPNHGTFQVTRDNLPVTILAPGLAGAEEVDLFYSIDGGTNWNVLHDKDGAVVVLTATIDSLAIDSPFLLGALKDATVAAVGVFIDKGV